MPDLFASYYSDLDLSPIIDLFSHLPEGTGKVVLILALALGFGALLAIKAPSSSTQDLIWFDLWDKWWDD
jgi:hypothetical protein